MLWPIAQAGQQTDIPLSRTTNAERTLANYKALAAKAQTVVPGVQAGSGGQTGSTDTPTGTGDAATATPTAGGAGMLTIPGTAALVALGAAALFL